jgi:thiol-disulfide isomerase/thioredoxin
MSQTRRHLLISFGLGLAGAVGASYGLHHRRSVSASSVAQPQYALSEKNEVSGLHLPEFVGISDWLNSPPLAIADLKGKVVAVQFWTFACINSQRTLPYITSWHQKYADQGLVIIGVHTPELQFEYDINNVKDALKQHDIIYPVAIDNQYLTWNAYQNRYWPHLFIANRKSIMVYDHVGEGAYRETEQIIQQLLG